MKPLLVLLVGLPLALDAQATVRVRDLMTPAEVRATGVSKLSADEQAALDTWFTQTVVKFLSSGIVTPRVSVSPSPAAPTPGGLSIADLEGAIVIANDGEFLGKITSNQFDSQSFLNQFGKAGNEFSSTSILNQFSKYGNEFSSLSPFNQFSSTPPRILKGDRVVGYLTKNVAKTPRLDPDLLLGWIKSNR